MRFFLEICGHCLPLALVFNLPCPEPVSFYSVPTNPICYEVHANVNAYANASFNAIANVNVNANANATFNAIANVNVNANANASTSTNANVRVDSKASVNADVKVNVNANADANAINLHSVILSLKAVSYYPHFGPAKDFCEKLS